MTYEYIPSPNKSDREGHQVSGLIAHFTAGGSLNSTVRYMCNLIKAPDSVTSGVVINNGVKYYDAQASCHYMTGREGKTVRLVPDNEAAWHAGSKTTKPELNGKRSLNLWTIGHEICNWGGLLKRGDKFYCWPSNWTKEYKGPNPVCVLRKCPPALSDPFYRVGGKDDGSLLFAEGIIEYWEPYTDEQIKAVIKLWKEIIERYDISREWIAGHEAVDPTRKIDPGPAFPWDDIFAELYPPNIDKKKEIIEPLEEDHMYELLIPNKSESRNEPPPSCFDIIASILK